MLIALSIVSYRSITASTLDVGWVQHTYDVIDRLDGLLAATQDIETGYRGFIISGDERFLAAYTDGLAKAPAAVAAIATLTGDNPVQQRRIPTLTALVARKM